MARNFHLRFVFPIPLYIAACVDVVDPKPPLPVPHLLLIIHDRSGTTRNISPVKREFYGQASQMLVHGRIAVLLAGNPCPELEPSIGLDIIYEQPVARYGSLEAEGIALQRADSLHRANESQRTDWIEQVDRQVLQYKPCQGKDLSFLDSTFSRAHQLLTSPLYQNYRITVLIISDGKNEDALGRFIPFRERIGGRVDNLILLGWVNPDYSAFANLPTPAVVESTADALKLLRAYFPQN